jgi:hypothetical protein
LSDGDAAPDRELCDVRPGGTDCGDRRGIDRR